MTQRPAVLLLYPAALAGLAAILYALNWRRDSTTMLQEIRATLKEDRNLLASLRDDERYDAKQADCSDS